MRLAPKPTVALCWGLPSVWLLLFTLPLGAWQVKAQDTPNASAWKTALVSLGASLPTQELTHWVMRSADHQGLPFVVIDKIAARVFVFNPEGHFLGAAPALLGLATGDEGVAGLGDRPLAQITPQERTTPAGRYLAELDRNVSGQTILWVDYAQAISMHPVRSLNPNERRLERLATPSARDNRISHGCINVSTLFWKSVILPAFRSTPGVVYVLPESSPLESVFIGVKAEREAAVK